MATGAARSLRLNESNAPLTFLQDSWGVCAVREQLAAAVLPQALVQV
jgi:hypothetical protein